MRRACDQNQQRRSDDAHFARMYGSRDVLGKGEKKTGKGSDLQKSRFNLVRSVTDTAHSHIASKRPKPKFNTDDADWSLVQKAQACSQAIKGIFAANGMYELAGESFLDAAVTSIGGLHVFSEHGRVKIERIYPGEIVVDVREGYYGRPRTIYRLKLVDKYALAETYPKFKVNNAPGGTESEVLRYFDWADQDTIADQVVVVEAWHLGSKKDKDGKLDGRHVIATSAQTLVDEVYTRERFPLVFFRTAKRQIGFYGVGFVEKLRGHQAAINYIDLKVADMMHNNSRSTTLIPRGPKGQKINVNHLTNDPSTFIEVPFGASAPIPLVANAVPTEYFARRREIIEDGYAEIGVSQLTATGQVPKGLDSGVAIREAEDVGSRRFAPVVQGYEQLFVDVGRVIIDELRDLAETGKIEPIQTLVRKGSRSRVELIDWSKVSLDDHQYTLDVTPASSLPDSTAGRTATVIDWMNAGLCTPQEAKALLDHPDLEAFKSLDLASYEVILDTIESIVEDGDYNPPEPTDDLKLALKLITLSYNKFRLRKVPRARLDLLLEYLEDVRALDAMAMSANPQAAPAPQPQPQAAPATPGAAPVAIAA